jgi:hypothetical protein
LKSKWLDGKRNRRVDNLINVLINDLLPNIEHRLKQQEVIKQGDDLASCHWWEIQACAPETPWEHITQVEHMHFQVCSSKEEKFYDIDLLNTKCTCLDFPQIEFCKHLASVKHYFGGAAPPAPPNPSQPSPMVPALPQTKDGNTAHDDGVASLIPLQMRSSCCHRGCFYEGQSPRLFQIQ